MKAYTAPSKRAFAAAKAKEAVELKKALAAWEKNNQKWDADIVVSEAHAPEYITPGRPDSEPYDRRKAVAEPHVGRDGLPVLGELQEDGTRTQPEPRYVKVAVFDGVAPAPLRLETEADLQARLQEDARQDAIDAHVDAIRARAMREYDGQYPKILALLLQGRSVEEIADETGYTSKHIRNLTRGNSDRPAAGDGLNAWVEGFLRSVWQGDVPISVEPVHTKKSLQDQAVVAQMGWDFEAMESVGVQA